MTTFASTEELGSLNFDKEDHNVTHRKKSSSLTGDANNCEQDLVSPEVNMRGITQKDSVAELKSYMSGLIQKQTDSLRAAITALTETIKMQNTRIEKLEARVEELENNQKLHPDVSSLENSITNLQAELHDRDQALLSNDVEIAGYPEEASENCTHIFIALAKKININLDEKDVVSAEKAGPLRPSGQGGAPPPPAPLGCAAYPTGYTRRAATGCPSAPESYHRRPVCAGTLPPHLC